MPEPLYKVQGIGFSMVENHLSNCYILFRLEKISPLYESFNGWFGKY